MHTHTGFFKSLHQEFILTQTPVSITIMPLPLVMTKKVIHPLTVVPPLHLLHCVCVCVCVCVQAVEVWKPRSDSGGITPEVYGTQSLYTELFHSGHTYCRNVLLACFMASH